MGPLSPDPGEQTDQAPQKHSFSHLSSAVDRAGPIPMETKLVLILILAVMYGTAQAQSTSPPAPDSQMSALRCCQRA